MNNTDIEWYIYVADTNRFFSKPADDTRCRHRAWSKDDYWPHQCTRKPKMEIEGYGFCKQHGVMVCERLAREEGWKDIEI